MVAIVLAVIIGIVVWRITGDDRNSLRVDACPIGPDTVFPDTDEVATLEEARQRSYFGVGVPEYLPAGVSLRFVGVQVDPSCPDERIRSVHLGFDGPGYTFTIEESGGGPGKVSQSEPFRFNGMEGLVFRRADPDGRHLVAFHWADSKRGYAAYAFLDGGLTEASFLEILESIPE